MKLIKEIWGNGTDVIIKYTKDDSNQVWIAASKWLNNNSNLNDKFLIKNGYEKVYCILPYGTCGMCIG